MFKLIFLLLSFALPNIILAFVGDSMNLAYIALSLNFTFIILILSRDTKNFIYSVPFLILLPIPVYYALVYQKVVDTFAISVALDSSYYEIKSFFGDRLALGVVILACWSVFIIYLYVVKRNSWNVALYPKKYFKFAVIVIFAIFGLGYFILDHKQHSEFNYTAAKTYPYNLVSSGLEVHSELKKMKDVESETRNFKFHATQSPGAENQTIVLVIGETGRRNHWGLNGYSRDTTPLLSKQENLINFSDMLSLAPATIVSVPTMLTRKPEDKLYQYVYEESSVIRAFKEVGFKTYWISTQQKVSTFDTLTSAYAKDADEVKFFNFTKSNTDRDMDDVLIPELKNILAEKSPKKFIVIHTLGSHQQYNKRYPKSYNVFKPSLDDITSYIPQSSKYKQQSINSYDNSVLFTDFVLNSFIEEIKVTNTSSMLLYAADHGEDLFDDGCEKSGHGNGTIYNFQIPAIAWVSDQYKQYHPDNYNALRSNATAKVNLTSIFPTLVDSAGITIPNYQPVRSLFRTHTPYRRIVLHGVDYDKTAPVGQCKELANTN